MVQKRSPDSLPGINTTINNEKNCHESFVLPYIGVGGDLGHVTQMPQYSCLSPHPNKGSTQNLALIVQAVSEKKMFEHCGRLTPDRLTTTGTNNPRIRVQSVKNRLREICVRLQRPYVFIHSKIFIWSSIYSVTKSMVSRFFLTYLNCKQYLEMFSTMFDAGDTAYSSFKGITHISEEILRCC